MAEGRKSCRGRGGGEASVWFSFFLFLFASPLLLPLPGVVVRADSGAGDRLPEGNGEGHRRHGPNAAERAMGIAAPSGAWATIRSWIKLSMMNLWPPDTGVWKSRPSAGKAMEEAAMRSFEMSKSVSVEAAKSAARVAEATVKKTKEKVKRAMSPKHGGGADL